MVPAGEFVSGALFMRPGVNLHLEKGGVLRCSTDLKNFQPQRTRIEGHFEEHFNPALINADGCDGLRISGDGMLDGAGKPVWDEFWARRNAAKDPWNFRNLDVARARLCLIENSKGVTVEGITYKDAQFWNLHLYNCEKVMVQNVRFEVPDHENPPSSDGVDIDSCRDVWIKDCWFSVNDDCIALKGTKGPFALEDKTSPPVENVRVSGCVFRRGHHAITCGSEATIVRDILIEDCLVRGAMPLIRLKLRPDTPQCYEHMTFRNIEFENDGASVFEIAKWTQYFDLQGLPEPLSNVRHIRVSGIRGSLGALGKIQGNRMTRFGDIILEDVDVKAGHAGLKVDNSVETLTLDNVLVNGRALLNR